MSGKVYKCTLKKITPNVVSEIYAMHFDPLFDKPEDLRKFIKDSTGVDSYDGKVYTNGTGGVALICKTGFTSESAKMELRLLEDGYVVVFRYQNGGHDIYWFTRQEFAWMFDDGGDAA